MCIRDREKYREEFKSLAKSDEDVLSLALFPLLLPLCCVLYTARCV